MTTLSNDELLTLAAAVVAKVKDQIAIPTLVPATVLSWDASTWIATVAVDGDDGDTIQCGNLTGLPLSVDTRVMIGFFPPRGVYVVGVLNAASLPHVDAAQINGAGAGTTNSTAFVDWPQAPATGPLQIPNFKKHADDSLLLVHIYTGRFTTSGTAAACIFGVNVNSTDATACRALPPVATEANIGGVRLLGNIPSGEYDITMRARVGSAVATLATDGNTVLSMSVQEVLA
jgi:hypothetical protein